MCSANPDTHYNLSSVVKELILLLDSISQTSITNFSVIDQFNQSFNMIIEILKKKIEGQRVILPSKYTE